MLNLFKFKNLNYYNNFLLIRKMCFVDANTKNDILKNKKDIFKLPTNEEAKEYWTKVPDLPYLITKEV